MAEQTLEDRVAVLEQKVAILSGELVPEELATDQPGKDDWRSTVGMFANDPIMKEIDEEGRKIREADRRAARRQCNDNS